MTRMAGGGFETSHARDGAWSRLVNLAALLESVVVRSTRCLGLVELVFGLSTW
jgi:hypothetical protein